MSPIKFSRLLIPLLSMISLYSQAQSSTGQKKQNQYAKLKAEIDSKKYSFHALSATSLKGRTFQLTSEYYLKINDDSLQVDLPYYGQSYSTPYPANADMGVQFNTRDFTYQSDSAKKGGWEITIKPKNENAASLIYLSVSSGGYCTVRITSITRNPITYYGTITDYEIR